MIKYLKSMRLFWIVFILICSVGAYLSGPNSPFSKDNVEELYSYKVINDVNLRDKPSSKSNIIDVLKQNESIVIVDSVNNWYNITDTDSNNGYVSKKYITKTITNSNTSEIQPSINNKIILAIVCLGFVYFIFMRNKSKDDLKVKSVSSNKASIISKAKDPKKNPLLDNKPLKNMTVSKGKPIQPLTDWPIWSLQNYLNNLREKGGDEKTIKFVKDLIKEKAKSLRNSKPKEKNKSKKSNVKKSPPSKIKSKTIFLKDDDIIDVTKGVGKDLIKALNSPIQTTKMYDNIKLKINNNELTKKEWKKELDKVNEWIDSYVRDFYENSLAELIFLRVQLQLILEYEIDPIVLDVIELIKNHSSFIPKKEELGSNLYQSLMEKLKDSDINNENI